MGGKPSARTILYEYVDRLPVLPQGVSSGEQIYKYYLQQATNRDIGVYNEIR